MNNVEKIDDCTVRIEKETILVLASRMVSFVCAGHGMSSVGVKPTTGSYRQV